MKRILFVLSVVFAFSLSACDQSQAPTEPTGAANKATVYRDLPFSGAVLNTCCHDQEWINLTGVAKLVENDNGLHVVIKELTGVCIFGNHHYTAEGATTENVNVSDDGGWQVVLKMTLINDGDGCPSMTLKIHYKIVWNEDTASYELQYDHSELICGDTAS